MLIYSNMKKVWLLHEKIIFLGYIVSLKSIEMDDEKFMAIQEWLTPKSTMEVRSFHGLTNFIVDLLMISTL